MTISFYVSGEPKAQPRPKAFARKMGETYVARVYTPGTAEHWKTMIADAARKAGITKTTGPVALEMYFNFKRPKSHLRSNGQLRESAPLWHMQKPDFDNLEKAVVDALTVIGAWDDDAQIVDVRTAKNWSIAGWPGGCSITIMGLEQGDPRRGEPASDSPSPTP